MGETVVVRKPKNTTKPGVFGPNVIGAEEFAAESEFKEKGMNVFGPNVAGPSEPTKPTAAQLRAQPDLIRLMKPGASAVAPSSNATSAAQLSVSKLTDALEDNPFILDGVIAAEYERPDGPRIGALRVMLKAEQDKAEPRADVVMRLQTSIKEKAQADPAPPA